MSARVPVVVAGVLAVSGLAVAAVPARVAMRAELRKRWRTWALAAPVYLGALWLGRAGAFALAAGLGVVAVAEYARMTAPAAEEDRARVSAGGRQRARASAPGRQRERAGARAVSGPGVRGGGSGVSRLSPGGALAAGVPSGDLLVLAGASVLLPALAWLAPGVLDLRAAALLLVAAVLPALLGGDAERGFTRGARNVFGLLWIPVALTGLVLLGPGTAMAVGLAVALGDVGAWCGGTALGRRGPLARPLSALSPNKTWAGVAGCAAATAVALVAAGAFSPVLWGAVLLGCLLGDLLESMVKRESGVKDAGSWLPGFGGLLDRIDSLLLALLLAMVVTL
ncbi:phosphatidate cytidylyltransferase [Streptomyces sp. NPDC004111]|uniref:phosphatidate cytidylyltransferase n=1 Tax=Streptomyces sp. NPDC004111 TaxID=3364690 RepID=UPI0036BCE27E